jgi:hypothetical protein
MASFYTQAAQPNIALEPSAAGEIQIMSAAAQRATLGRHDVVRSPRRFSTEWCP